jgi:hypothetical protein
VRPYPLLVLLELAAVQVVERRDVVEQLQQLDGVGLIRELQAPKPPVSYLPAKAGGMVSQRGWLAEPKASASGRLTTAQPRARMFTAAIRSASPARPHR